MNFFLIFSEALIVLTVSCGLVLHSNITKGEPRKDFFSVLHKFEQPRPWTLLSHEVSDPYPRHI